MKTKLEIFHGSTRIIERPTYGKGNPHNDYGLGFYCTESLDLAKEWGASEESEGYANKYTLQTKGLTELNLNSGDYTILHWLALLLENRVFRVSGNIAPLAREFLLERFAIDYSSYDLIRGYRADDSYFSFANAFLNNALSLSALEQAMMLGDLGEQIVLKSEKAFDHLQFTGFETADRTIYYPRKIARDQKARSVYRQELKLADVLNDVTIQDIMRQDWGPDDARLRRIVS